MSREGSLMSQERLSEVGAGGYGQGGGGAGSSRGAGRDLGTSPLWTDARWGGAMGWVLLKRGRLQECAAGRSICSLGKAVQRKRLRLGVGGVRGTSASPLKGNLSGRPKKVPLSLCRFMGPRPPGRMWEGFLGGAFHRGEKEIKAVSRPRLKETGLWLEVET